MKNTAAAAPFISPPALNIEQQISQHKSKHQMLNSNQQTLSLNTAGFGSP